MLKIIKLSRNLKGRCVNRCWSSNAKRYQFRLEEPIYYPKRDVFEKNLIGPLVLSEKAVKSKRTMVPQIDYYKILGVDKEASQQEIKTAYYNLAKKFHPDVQPTPQETESFQKISEAYHVLSEDSNRNEYDKYGTVKPFQPFLNEITLGTNQPTVDTPASKKRPSFLNSWDSLPTPEHKVPIKDIQKLISKNEAEIDLKFLQAIHGGKEYIDMKAMIKCPKCNGSARLGSQINIEFCQKCGGTGQYRNKEQDSLKYKVCNCCNGKRYVQKNDCSTCENRGFVVQSQRVEVIIPPGISNGEIIKLKNPINQQVIKVRVNVDKSIYFKRDGNNVATDKYLTISQAVLGGKFKIRGLYEDLQVNLGPGVDSHTTHCFKGKGICTPAGPPGDHIVTFKIRVPKNLTTKQRQLILALSRTEDPMFDGQ